MADALQFDDLVEDKAPEGGAPSFDSLQDDSEKYGSAGNMLLSGLEGAANIATVGLYGKAAKAMDEKLGLDPEFHSKVAEENPISHGAGQVAGLMVGPVGKAIGAAGKGAQALAGAGIRGSAARFAAEGALFQTTDELAKKVMADPHQSLETAAINIGLAGLFGGGLGAAGGILGKGVAKVADSGAGKFLSDFRSRVLEHITPAEENWVSNPEYLKAMAPRDTPMYIKGEPTAPSAESALSVGAKAADTFMNTKVAGHAVAMGLGELVGKATGIPYMGHIVGGLSAKELGPTLDAIIKPLLHGALSGEGLEAASKLMSSVAKGENALANAAKAVFDKGLEVLPSKLTPTREDRDKLNESLEKAQSSPDSIFNTGGPLEHYMPSHNVALGQLTANAVQYLDSLKPRVSGGTNPLDTKVPPSKADQANYDRALDIAQQPLMIMQHIKHGTVLGKDLVHFANLYPSLHRRISQELTNNMIEHQAKGHAIPYKTRMGLSMFMNQPMDSTMLPVSIMAAQAVYLPKEQPQQGPIKAKHSTAPLSKVSSRYQTSEQSREARRNK